jgi:hypothetical protein
MLGALHEIPHEASAARSARHVWQRIPAGHSAIDSKARRMDQNVWLADIRPANPPPGRSIRASGRKKKGFNAEVAEEGRKGR